MVFLYVFFFNFTVYETETRHPFEQKPIKDDFKVEVINKECVEQVKPISIKNDDKYKADVIDSDNKENTPPQIKKTKYIYLLTMLNFKQDFDKMYKLPKVRKTTLTSKPTSKLAEVEEKMKLIKKK